VISLWRNTPVLTPDSHQDTFKLNNIFPSGRQALSYCLKHAGLSRKDRIAIPEWSSHCVISAVGKIATPIPITEVVKFDIDVSAVLIYDQWGWPMFENCRKEFSELFNNKIIIHDAVDTVNIFGDNSRLYSEFEDVYTIFSLSKILGLEGGSIANFNGQYLPFIGENNSMHELIYQMEKIGIKDINIASLMTHFKKSEILALPAGLVDWLKTNSLFDALELEKANRRKNIRVLSEYGLTNSWPKWIKDSLSEGATPGIIPLLNGVDSDILLSLRDKLVKKCNLRSEIYNFDWNGSIIESDYQKCIAIPIHGEVENIHSIADTISSVKYK
jgi:hypothetical protein